MIRTTCLYCEQKGIVSKLVRQGHWAHCPRCEPEWCAHIQRQRKLTPELIDVGVPHRPGP